MNKPHLLILGGIGDIGEKSYSALIREIKNDFQIVRFPYPGFGNTAKPKGTTLESDIEVIRTQLKSLKLKELIIFSHSIGTAYAFELCYPNDLNIKAVIATNPFTVSNKNLLQPLLQGINERRNLNNWLRKNKLPVEFRPFNFKSIFNLHSYLRTAKIFRHLNLKIDLGKADVPVLAIIGDRDKLISKKTQMTNLNLIKHLQVVHFDEGHYFVHTKSKEVAELIKEFAKSSGITL